MVADVVLNRGNELVDIAEDTAADSFVGKIPKESFDHIEPGSAGGSEVNVESSVTKKPALHFWVFVCGIVIGDQMDCFFLGSALIDQAEKLQSFLMSMPVFTKADDRTDYGVHCRKQSRRSIPLIVVRHGATTALL